jgi:hypothetical protein
VADAVEGKTPMTMVGEWEQLDLIGEGGQGLVYRARSPKRVGERSVALTSMIGNLPYGPISVDDKRVIGDRFAAALWDYARPDHASELGALKIFKFDSDRQKPERRWPASRTRSPSSSRIDQG